MKQEIWRKFDYWLFGVVLILCIFGIAMIRSAIAGNVKLSGLVGRQAIYVGFGLVIIIVVAMIDYHYWASLSRVMYAVTVVALLVIYVVGAARFGSARWLDTGLILIQPSEIAKIVVILVLANYFDKTQHRDRDWRWVIYSFLLTFGVVIWILLQPNLSTSIVIFVLWFALIWLSGLPPKYIAVFVGGGIMGIAALFPFLQGYQKLRILDFIFPNPSARHGNTYNVDQALISIGSGGWFGEGYGHSTQVQLRFLKVRHTDFIFSALSAEFGLIGALVVLALLIFVVLRCIRAARLAPDLFGAMIAYGFAILILFQTAVNVGVNLNVIPVTGLTLPFISYGGSSLISFVLGIGLVESVVARNKSLEK